MSKPQAHTRFQARESKGERNPGCNEAERKDLSATSGKKGKAEPSRKTLPAPPHLHLGALGARQARSAQRSQRLRLEFPGPARSLPASAPRLSPCCFDPEEPSPHPRRG